MYPFTTIHASIIEASPTQGVALWYFCRIQDHDGRGWVDLPIKSVATFLDRKPATIRRWIEECLRDGFLRGSLKAGVGAVRVFLASRDQVCLRLKLKSYGATARVSLGWLRNLKAASTDATIKLGQKASVRAALIDTRETKGKSALQKFIPPESLVRSWSYSNWENVVYGTSKRVYMDEESICVGVSQVWVGDALGRDRRTITRRLSEAYRIAHHLAPVAKKQVVARVGFTDKDAEVGDLPIYAPKQFVMKGQLWEMKCNVYDIFEIELTSARCARYFYNRKQEAAGI